MATYARAECGGCHRICGKDEMHGITREVSVLRSGSSVGVRQNGRRRGGLLWSWNSGRKYYTRKTEWLCDECYQRHERAQAIKGGLVLLAILTFIGIAYFGGDSQPSTLQQVSSSTSATPTVLSPTSLKSSTNAGTTLGQAPSSTASGIEFPPQAAENGVVANAVAPANSWVQSTNTDALSSWSDANVASVRGGPIGAESANAPQVAAISDVGPSIESRGAIHYPTEALRSGEDGVVVLDVAVSASGVVENVTVVRSSGYRPLDNAAVESVRRWQFSPGRRNGQPVDGDVRVPVNFSLSQTK